MDLLKQLLNDDEIQSLLEQMEDLKYVSRDDIRAILKFMSDLMDKNNRKVRTIIMTNPYVLMRKKEDLEELYHKLQEYSFQHIPRMFEEFPYFLNKDAYEIDGFFIRKKKQGVSLDDARMELEKDPYKIEL